LFAIIGSCVICSSNTIGLAFFGRFIQGAGFGTLGVSLRAILRDYFHGKLYAKKTSYIISISLVVTSLSPIIGGSITSLLSWKVCFAFIAILLFITIIIAKIYVGSYYVDNNKIKLESLS